MQGSRLAFGPFVLDSAVGTLRRNDVPIAVGYRGLKLLAALAGRPGEILGKAALMDAAWPDAAVEEGNLTVQISQLRKLLGPAADGGEWIVTVPRVGYRFTGVVEQLGGARREPLPLPDRPSIAVLPFASFSTDPEQEFFADGLTEDLITDLSRIPGLFVIARNSAFLQGKGDGRARDRPGARRALPAGGERTTRRGARAHQRPAGRRGAWPASMGGTLRPQPGGHLRRSGRGDPQDRGGVARPAARPAAAQPAQESRGLRSLRAGAPADRRVAADGAGSASAAHARWRSIRATPRPVAGSP